MRYFCFKDKKIPLGKKTYVMGILNVTPDSFSDGGKNFSVENATLSAIEMEKQGADFIDVGAQSTRPGATLISEKEEWDRLKAVLPKIIGSVKIPVSVDTFYPFVAKKSLELGASIINDVSGTVSLEMAEIIKEYNAGWVLMHNCEVENDPICEVHSALNFMRDTAVKYGVKLENVCLDPGIGFAKTMEQNRLLIKETQKVRVDSNAYLLGVSRKRVIGFPLGQETEPKDRDFATISANTIGILGGADIIRVHNVAAAVQSAKVSDYILREV